MSIDTDYLSYDNFYLTIENNLRFKVDEEYQKKSMVFFVKREEKEMIKRYKELLALHPHRYIAIAYLSDELREMINKSSTFIMNRYIVFYNEGEEKEKMYLTERTVLENIFRMI